MKKIIFDFDGTLFSETSEDWLELYHLIQLHQPRSIWLWSNGLKWLKKQSLSQIQFDHIEVEARYESDLELVTAAIEHAIAQGYRGNPDNAALVKRCPENAVLVDDLASTWVAIGKSHPDSTLTPEQFIEKLKDRQIELGLDDAGYLIAI